MKFKRVNPQVQRWTNGKNQIILPCDKKTFRVVDMDCNLLIPKSFRSFAAAEIAALSISA